MISHLTDQIVDDSIITGENIATSSVAFQFLIESFDCGFQLENSKQTNNHGLDQY